jgi:hypothetical protein
MGGSGSKPEVKPPPTPEDISKLSVPGLDLSKFTVSGDYVEQLRKQGEDALKKAKEGVKSQVGIAGQYKIIGGLLGLVVVGILLALLIDFIAVKITGHELTGFGWLQPSGGGGSSVSPSNILYIGYARYGKDETSDYQDVTDKVTSMIIGETTLPSFTVGFNALGLSSDPYPNELKTLYVQYYVGTGGYTYASANDGYPFPQLPQNVSSTGPSAPLAAPPPSFGSRIYNAIFGDSSGDLAPSYHDASSSAIIQGNRAPLSAQSEGGYGMQWWMYVKDWNYGYGKKKSVVKRPDTTNSSVTNPHISLHPTDNTLQISVSVFPTSEGGASKSAPAPAGHSGSTDDVFVCDVPNIPLQTWFSVSVTVFGRNLDVYIDGKLVKSCFLSGVPKPAVGDIQLTPEGGFSGRICNFYHYPRMLTPTDAMTFYSAGTTCKNKTESGVAGKTTGYSVKFGVYDSLGKNVQEYTF